MTKIVTNIILGQHFHWDIFVSQALYSTFFKRVTSTQKNVTEKNTTHPTTLHDTKPHHSNDTTPDQRNNSNNTPETPPKTIPFLDTTRYYTTPHNTTVPYLTTLLTKVYHTHDSIMQQLHNTANDTTQQYT